MKVIIDTNVLVSGIFFTGPPSQILQSWKNGKIEIVISADILSEYREVCEELSLKYRGIEVEPILNLIAIHSELIEVPVSSELVCTDPADQKFIACAIAGNVELIISGDKQLLKANGYKGIKVLTPRLFIENQL